MNAVPQHLRLAAPLLVAALAATACADDSYVIPWTANAVDTIDPATAALITTGEGHLAEAACTRGPRTCPGATWPDFAAPNFQPASSLKDSKHGLEIYKGKIIIVAMLAAW